MSQRVCAVFLCTVVAEMSAWVLTPADPAGGPAPSPHHYYHTDRESGTLLLCSKCPAGTYVWSHCSVTALRECRPCPLGTFTRGENGVQRCHRCQPECPDGFLEKALCTPTQDRVCACPPGSFLPRDAGARCRPHSLCPPGTRVKKRGGAREDVVCRPCTKGTFSHLHTNTTQCTHHTHCESEGLVLITAGTKETDNLCGAPAMPRPPALSPAPLAVMGQETFPASPAPLSAEEHKGSIQLKEHDKHTQHQVLGSISISEGPVVPSIKHQMVLGSGLHQTTEGRGPRGGLRMVSAGIFRRRGSPRPGSQTQFDINEHLPWMMVLLLLLVLVVIVVCSVKSSSRVLKKGPIQDPCSIIEKTHHKNVSVPSLQNREKWIYYCNGQGVDILKLVSSQLSVQWMDVYQLLANASEREVDAVSNGYRSDQERALAALQHWTIRDSDANLAKLINALHRQRRIDVVEKIRYVMEENAQFDINHVMSISPVHRPLESPSSTGSVGSGGLGIGSGAEQSLCDRTKGFFPDESEPLLRCDSTSSKDSALSRTGSFITKEKKDTVLRQVRLDPCDLQPVFDDMLHILNPDELLAIEQIHGPEDKLDLMFEIAGVKSQEASQTLLDSVYAHLPDLL
ncbi:tumor necrosis factor receptor superfamily member 21 [Gouania willdenowi]|uniref:Tumor necrosis factor receptor superfamily member 21 n=1 Tax=Gouania willdenowi TaxID=441366 RepID=A0A8C5DIW9_GOUWI|nr:tumor necrosis factor receptor superfamily member 21 [Gouania willdenowi]XP_028295434.1 tumor necrosis factor receptor superfamily member 21 [Gouania willdenowi]